MVFGVRHKNVADAVRSNTGWIVEPRRDSRTVRVTSAAGLPGKIDERV